jgi:hypothetical protein
MRKALFEGLVRDQHGTVLPVTYVGQEPTYVLTEDNFKYHVDAQKVDLQVLSIFREQILEHKDQISSAVLKLLGQDDLFTKAAVDAHIRNLDQHFNRLFETGIPEPARQYLGMLGFSVSIDRHGNVVDLTMPSVPFDPGDADY